MLWLALIAPEPCHAHRRTQLPRFCLLLTRNSERTLEISFPPSLYPARATSAPFRRPCDAPQFCTISPWLFPLLSALRQASSNWPQSAYGFAKCDKYHGVHGVEPAERHAVLAEVVNWAALEVLPVRATGSSCSSSRPFHRRIFRMPRLQARRPVRLPLRNIPLRGPRVRVADGGHRHRMLNNRLCSACLAMRSGSSATAVDRRAKMLCVESSSRRHHQDDRYHDRKAKVGL
jgi:hypothetical protein